MFRWLDCYPDQWKEHCHCNLLHTYDWCAAGISLAEELDVDAILSGIAPEQKQDRQQKLTDTAWKATVEEFKSLSEAIHNDDVRANSSVHSQPWRE